MKRKKEIVGGLITILGLTLAIIAVPPNIWKENFDKWFSSISTIGDYLLTLLIGILITTITFLLMNKKKNKYMIPLITGDEYIKEFHKLLKSAKYPIVKIFGYTGEVVNNDLITYLDRYHSGVEIRYLHRNWLIERQDEFEHNKVVEHRGIRPWNKAKAIEKTAFEEWNFTLKRDIRYYKHQPILKGVIFCNINEKPVRAYINFQKWVPIPANGGSAFKSVPSDMVKFDSKHDIKFQELVNRIDSQFEFEWYYGDKKEDLSCEVVEGQTF